MDCICIIVLSLNSLPQLDRPAVSIGARPGRSSRPHLRHGGRAEKVADYTSIPLNPQRKTIVYRPFPASV